MVGFADATDIRAVYNFEQGMISTAHIPAFFEHHRHPSRPLQPPAWLYQVFARIPTWDRVLTTRGEWINGILLDQELIFRDAERVVRRFPYQSIQSATLQRAGGLFSAYDHLTLIDTRGTRTAWKSAKGEVHLRRFGNEVQTHQLRNVSQILVGVANKRDR